MSSPSYTGPTNPGLQSVYRNGYMNQIDTIAWGDTTIASALNSYSTSQVYDHKSIHWHRVIRYVENILFLAGRHYLDDLLLGRIARSIGGDISLIKDSFRNLPKPTNDIIGRYIEANVSLLTDNKPIAKIYPMSDDNRDIQAAKLSELTYQFLSDSLNLPHMRRQIARLILSCGVAWMEIAYDPTQPRHLPLPIEKGKEKKKQETTPQDIINRGGEGLPEREYEKDEKGRFVYSETPQYGDIALRIVSPFEMFLPNVHYWDSAEMGWVMREYYAPIEAVKSQYAVLDPEKFSPEKGWFLDRLQKISPTGNNIQFTPLWWWERLSQIVEGSGTNLYTGTPDLWTNYTTVKVFDRKPNAMWPKGRTIIAIGDQVLYDSPPEVGARAYDPRWPKRWHPYVIYRWEPLPTTDIYCRPLVTKLLPKIKRINAIDTTLILWRRASPFASWIVPKGAAPREGQWMGGVAQIWEYDPRRTAAAEPKPIFPPDFPAGLLEERRQQLAEVEMIAGTEEVLRGQRPAGVRSVMLYDALRREALASRSAILQSWDTSLENEASLLLQTTIKHMKDDDPVFAERLKILARNQVSDVTIDSFSGSLLSDNVEVEIDTASQAVSSREARKAMAVEFLRYSAGLMSIPFPSLRQKLVEEIGFGEGLSPQGPDVDRARRLLGWLKEGRYERVVPFPEDDPDVYLDIFIKEMKSDGFYNLSEEQKTLLLALVRFYREERDRRIQQAMMQQMMMARAQAGIPPDQDPNAPPEQ